MDKETQDMSELRARRAFGKLTTEEINALDIVDRMLRGLDMERIKERLTYDRKLAGCHAVLNPG